MTRKRILLCKWLVLWAGTIYSQDDNTVFGIKTGINTSIFSSSINNNSDAGFKSGFHFGIYIKHPVSERFFFRPELYYSNQGQKDDYAVPPAAFPVGSTKTILNYINLPLLFETGREISFQFGPQVGIFLSGREKGIIDNTRVDENLKGAMKTADVGFILGFGVSPDENFNVGFRFNIGLTDIYKADDNFSIPGVEFRAVKNRVLHFYLGYTF